jgi:hypothetical protein
MGVEFARVPASDARQCWAKAGEYSSVGSNSEEKVLGVFWDTHLDNLGFKVAETPNAPFTKMELASRVAGVFDPLGTASPIIVKAKIRLRKLGQDGLQWTDVVGEEDRSWWLLWFKELRRLNDVAMPPCLFPNRLNLEVSELHTFCDASEEAYAAVIYVRSLFSKSSGVPSGQGDQQARSQENDLSTEARSKCCFARRQDYASDAKSSPEPCPPPSILDGQQHREELDSGGSV